MVLGTDIIVNLLHLAVLLFKKFLHLMEPELPFLCLRSPLLLHVLNSIIPIHTVLFQLTAMNHP